MSFKCNILIIIELIKVKYYFYLPNKYLIIVVILYFNTFNNTHILC